MAESLKTNILLEPQYVGSLSFWKLIVQSEKILFEQHENYMKRSYRNRCHILSPNGLLRLSIPLEHGKNQHCALKDVRISYNENWQKSHWQSLQSGYRRSPYFEFYEDKIIRFYEDKFLLLLDYNLQLFEVLSALIKIKPEYSLTTQYNKEVASGYSDFRNVLLPNESRSSFQSNIKPYIQVFNDRMEFQPEVSIFDLLFNLGNQTAKYLTD